MVSAVFIKLSSILIKAFKFVNEFAVKLVITKSILASCPA